MISAFVEQDSDLLAALRDALGDRLESEIDLGRDISDRDLEALHAKNRSAANHSRLILTVLPESSLARWGAMRALSLYRYGYSICPWNEPRHGGICVVRGEAWGSSAVG